jgi:hypothetical protein
LSSKETAVDIDGFMPYAVYGFLATIRQKEQKATGTQSNFTI